MTETKKLIVTAEAMTKIVEWVGAGREVHMFLCPDLGCLAQYFSPLPAIDCQRHAWKCPCKIERQSVLLDGLELEPPAEIGTTGRKVEELVSNLVAYGFDRETATKEVALWQRLGNDVSQMTLTAPAQAIFEKALKELGLDKPILHTWKIVSLDVWGNRKDGYEINSATYSGKEVDLPAEPTDAQVRAALIAAGSLRKSYQLRHLDFDGDDMLIQISRKSDDYPIAQIRREE